LESLKKAVEKLS